MLSRRKIEQYALDREAKRAAQRAALLVPSRSLHVATMGGGVSGETVPKSQPLRSEEYRRLVASLPCKHCGIVGYSQAAHPNTGKGAGTKTDDRECFPLCTVHPSPGGDGYVRGCHERFDQGALYGKASRRLLEPAWGADTRRHIVAAGLWPKDLPMLEEPAPSARVPG